MTVLSGVPSRVLAAGLVLAVVVVAGGCTAGSGDGDGGGATAEAATVAGLELVRYRDDRLSFLHPDGWQVETADNEAQPVRVELPRESADHAEALIYASWPIAASDDLENAIRTLGRSADEPEVSDFEQSDIQVPGATRAVLQTFTATDAVLDQDIPYRFWTVFAMSEVGRVLGMTVTALESSDVDVDALARAVIDSLVLEETWER